MEMVLSFKDVTAEIIIWWIWPAISHERFDLFRKYADIMVALGLMDAEQADAERQRKRLGEYRSRHLSSLLEAHWFVAPR